MKLRRPNVKFITIDGRVTLRGPVNSEAEKRLIGEIANQSTPAIPGVRWCFESMNAGSQRCPWTRRH